MWLVMMKLILMMVARGVLMSQFLLKYDSTKQYLTFRKAFTL